MKMVGVLRLQGDEGSAREALVKHSPTTCSSGFHPIRAAVAAERRLLLSMET